MDWPFVSGVRDVLNDVMPVFIVMYIVGGLCVMTLSVIVAWRQAHHRSEQDGRRSVARGLIYLIYAGAALAILGGLGIAVWADPVSGVISCVVPLITMYFCGVWPGKGSSSTTPSPVAGRCREQEEPGGSS
jgi:hypothetical protein